MSKQPQQPIKITTATKISMSRVFVTPFILFFYLSAHVFTELQFFTKYGKLIAFILFVLAALTDWLDGYVAKKYDQISETGKLLDPFADKILCIVGFLLIVTDFEILVGGFRPVGCFLPMPLWFAILALFLAFARDHVINALRVVAMGKGVAIAADKFGKAKTVMQYVAIGLLMFYAVAVAHNYFGLEAIGTVVQVYEFAALFALAVATVLSVVSAGNYLYQYRALYLGKREKKDWGEK